jgi:uncharacterized membrane protein YphA (DoxX/SURF4 family)
LRPIFPFYCQTSLYDRFFIARPLVFYIAICAFWAFALYEFGSLGAYHTYYMPFKEGWVFFTGTCLIAAAVSMILGKKDKLATTLLAVFLLIVVLLMHMPLAMSNTHESGAALINILKDISLAGGAMMYALHYAQD